MQGAENRLHYSLGYKNRLRSGRGMLDVDVIVT